jgi:hypothetical protein
MTFMAVNVAVGLLHRFLQTGFQVIVTFDVVQPVSDFNFPFAIHGHTIFGVRQILGRQPEIQAVLSHEIESPPRSDRRGAGFQSIGVQFAYKRDVAHRVVPVLRTKIEVINRQSLLKYGWVRTL